MSTENINNENNNNNNDSINDHTIEINENDNLMMDNSNENTEEEYNMDTLSVNSSALLIPNGSTTSKETILVNKEENEGEDDEEIRRRKRRELPTLNEEENRLSENSPRLYWIDCLNIFANYLVIFVYISNIYVKDFDIPSLNFYTIISYGALARTCIPLFVMISGLFLLNPQKKLTIETIYKKYICHIFKNYLFWSLFYSTIQRLLINPEGEKFVYDKSLIIEILKNFIVGDDFLWYLNCIIGLYISTPMIKAIISDRKLAWYTVLIGCIISQFIPTLCEFFRIILKLNIDILNDYINGLLINISGSFLCYYILGYLLNTHQFTKKQLILSYGIGILGYLLTIGFRIYTCHQIQNVTHILTKYYNISIVMGTYGTFVFFKYTISQWIKPWIERKSFRKLISSLSECSFGIFLIHMFFHGLFIRLGIHIQIFNPIFWIPIYATLLFILSYITIFMIRKIPILKHIV
ncbi:hypothetical protein BCR32DRAFT_298964 [Anaeromyces robustus]|uniref:Acyltransferase 3 domain-containing protein n=1 Tax=Anaeromyces robustus TaxID=1754192 RepID=A0A1Y1X8W9_9FUNG|nr:hypothetical protein BCR32DRAFT_298964 [Anaeromyces robustus]|eukprot:ORX82177.1 hypothetical protein BCR32DRAFT_298964 [Anaeromyces robustus]